LTKKRHPPLPAISPQHIPFEPRCDLQGAYQRQVYISPVQSESRPRPLPVRLPSLADFIASSETSAAMGTKERNEGARRIEIINELFGLEAALKTTSTQDDNRRWHADVRVRISNRLEDRSSDPIKKWIKEDGLETKRAGVRLKGVLNEEGVEDVKASSGDVARGADENSGQEGGRRARREWTEDEEAAAYRKVVELLQEPDPAVCPVARLRETMLAYQDTSDRYHGDLQSSLCSKDLERPNSLRMRAAHLQPLPSSRATDPKTSSTLMRLEAEKDMLQRHLKDEILQQYLWYRNLLHLVQPFRKELPRVAHFMFDFVKQVLEHGELFRRDMFFRMIGHIENFEFTELISRLIVSMVGGIDELTMSDVTKWFRENRAEVPACFAEVTGH